jgi:Ni,Fe-hydrogenase III small subunit
MRSFLTKLATTKKNVISRKEINKEQAELIVLGKSVQKKIGKLFGGSLSIREVDAGSDNACENELTALTNAFYDVDRFGIHFVASPRHADMLMVTGPVSRNMASAVISAYKATPDPKIVVAVGDDAIDGGIFKGNYAVMDGVKEVIPVDYAIPGDPPTPLAILRSLLSILEDLESKPKTAGKK